MPLTLTEFLLSIPITLGILFLPFMVWRLMKGRPLKDLMTGYVIASLGCVTIFFLMALYEQLLK